MLILGTNRKPRRYSGKLIDAEGIDGSGKTTALTKCFERAKELGYDCMWTEWSDSKLAGKALKKGKKKHRLTPITFTLLQACSIADRLETQIIPHLQKGGIVFADRWYYTCLARDVVRGMDPKYVARVFDFCPEADLGIWFKIDPAVALERKRNLDDEGIAYYEAGADLFPDLSREDGFLKFQGLCADRYQKIYDGDDLVLLDADRSIEAVEEDAWSLVRDCIDGLDRKAA
jgi:dTMP kinase